jgi:two-component system, NtrC family, response regulator GlrR
LPVRSSAHAATLTTLRRDAVELPRLGLLVHAPGGEQRVSLGVHPLVLGTHAECDVVIADPSLSRRHCQVALVEQGVLLTDLGSKNGTFVRDVRVREAFLDPGVPASAGGTRIEVELAGAPELLPLSLGASFGEAIGGTVVMRALFAWLERAAVSNETVLLLGESGTGKEVLARAIHDRSARRDGPFEVLDCAALAPSLVEAELFGYERGAFTGAESARQGVLERAHGGTLFIDEIGELPLPLQPKLLRALESREVRPLGSTAFRGFEARVVAATHRDLRRAVAAGAFRGDLYYRLAVAEARVPPLRERRADIPLLVERFLAAQTPPRTMADLPANAMALLGAHDWPGNVRELRNTVARLLVFPSLGRELFDGGMAAGGGEDDGLCSLPYAEARAAAGETFEREYLTRQLRRHGGNVSRSAAAMGISRQFLHRLLKQYGMRRDDG